MRNITFLKVDIDEKCTTRIIDHRLNHVIRMYNEFHPGSKFDVQYYQTKHGWHLYIKLNRRISDKDILIMQLLLGDDWKRSTFNYGRVISGNYKQQSWNILFAKKYKMKNKKLILVSKERRVI